MTLSRTWLGPAALANGETVVLRIHRHWSWLARDLLLPSILMSGAPLVWGLHIGGRGPVDPWMIGGTSVVGVFWTVGALLSWESRSLTLTTQRILVDRGLLIREWVAIELQRVVRVTVRQSLPGWLLGYGSLLIVTGGPVAPVVFDGAPRPRLLQEALSLST